jgi:hypothetical protein
MTTREQLIEILKKNIGTYQLCDDSDPINITGFEKSADKILALPLYSEITDADIDFRRDIANELSRDELIDRLCEMNESCRSMKKDEFGEFMEWLKTQPDQTMVTACLIRLWNSFKKQKKKE